MTKELIKQKSGDYLDEGYTCAQSVFKALKQEFDELNGIDDRVFGGFGGGFACRGTVCGTIVAATAIISNLKTDEKNFLDRNDLYKILREFYRDFEEENGSLNCKDIVGIDFLVPEEAARYKEEKHYQVCVPLVKNVAGKVYEIIK